MTTAISRLAPLVTHLRISRLVASPMVWGDIVRGLERMLWQQDDLASTGYPTTLKCILVQMLPVQQCLQDPNRQGAVQLRFLPSRGGLSLQVLRLLADMSVFSQMLTSPMAHQLKDVAMRVAWQRVMLLKPAMLGRGRGITRGELGRAVLYGD